MLNLLKAYMNKNVHCASWLITEFCNEEIIQETLLQCNQKEMRKFITGLLYCAMLKVYPTERNSLNNYWKNDQQEKFTVIGNFILIVIKNLYDLKKYTSNFPQYF